MGNKLVAAYKDYVAGSIKTEQVKDLVLEILKAGDDLNATEPASSSGKYHPIADLGKGGLVRHSIMVAEVAGILMRSRPKYDNDLDHDAVIASAILHDICKYETPEAGGKIHTNFDHPIIAAQLIKAVGEKMQKNYEEYYGELGVKDFNFIELSVRIASNVMTHMSRWNTSKYEPGLELPLIENEEQRIISDADLIAASSGLPELMISFREEAVKELAGR